MSFNSSISWNGWASRVLAVCNCHGCTMCGTPHQNCTSVLFCRKLGHGVPMGFCVHQNPVCTYWRCLMREMAGLECQQPVTICMGKIMHISCRHPPTHLWETLKRHVNPTISMDTHLVWLPFKEYLDLLETLIGMFSTSLSQMSSMLAFLWPNLSQLNWRFKHTIPD